MNPVIFYTCTQVHRLSQPKLTESDQVRETDVSKCIWQQEWLFWDRTLPVSPLLAHGCAQVHRLSQPKLTESVQVRETDVSKCVWQQEWLFWDRILPVTPPSLTDVHRFIGYLNPNWQSLSKSVRLTNLSVYDNRDKSSEPALFELFSPHPSSLTHVHNIQTPTLPTPTLLKFTCTQVLWFLSCLTRPSVSGVTTRPATRLNIISTRATQCM
jgi:hypothetical protein